jgi:hypothetical protein
LTNLDANAYSAIFADSSTAPKRGYEYMKDALKDAKKLKAAYEEVLLSTYASFALACWIAPSLMHAPASMHHACDRVRGGERFLHVLNDCNAGALAIPPGRITRLTEDVMTCMLHAEHIPDDGVAGPFPFGVKGRARLFPRLKVLPSVKSLEQSRAVREREVYHVIYHLLTSHPVSSMQICQPPLRVLQ